MELLLVWLKSLHIAALLIWIAGLMYLPAALLAHARARSGKEFVRIRRASRFAHTALASPAALVAIAAGTALLFVADVMASWMFAKLALVLLLAVGHLQFGTILGKLDRPSVRPPVVRLTIVLLGNLIVITGILYLVLGQPVLTLDWAPDWLHEPGGLQRLARTPI